MTNQTIRRLCLLIAAFTILCLASAVAYGQCEEKGEIPSGKLQIRNASESTQAHFSMRNGTGDWVQFSLDPGENKLYTTATSLKIVTKGGATKQYTLQDRCRYAIEWNEDEKCWVLYRQVQKC